MRIHLGGSDRIRFDLDSHGNRNFVDVIGNNAGVLDLTLFTSFSYIEIRKRGDLLKVFAFHKKSFRKAFDFKGWEDAEVVYSINQQIMNKG